MGNVYYGVCDSASDASTKEITLLPTADFDTISALQIGDLLTVYFANKNTQDSIKIVTDPDLTGDDGLTVKTLGENEQCANLWENGEAVIFVCTGLNENSESAPSEEGGDERPLSDWVYLRLFNVSPASIDVSGIIKLLTKPEGEVDIMNFLEEHINDEAAVAPWLLQDLYNRIMAFSDATFSYEYPENYSNTWITLGTLTINKNPGSDDPNDKQELIIKAPEQTAYSRTSQFDNDGDGIPVRPSWAEVDRGTKYIKNNPDTSLYFLNGEPNEPNGIPVYLYRQGSSQDYPIIGNGPIVEIETGNTLSVTQIFGDKIKLGGATITNEGAVQASSFEASGNITGAHLCGGEIFENNTSLKRKYSGKLSVVSHIFTYNGKTTLSLAKGAAFSTNPHPQCTITRSGYRCLGIVGHNYNYDTNKGKKTDAQYVNEWELFPHSGIGTDTVTLQLNITNTSQDTINVVLYVYLLWEKIN